MERGGRSYFFNYADLPANRPVPHSAFYTCNISLKRALLLRSGFFDESFPFASHEDLELGYRLEQQGLQLFHDPQALAYHWHPLDVASAVRRVYFMGYSSGIYWQKVPQSGALWRRLGRRVLAAAGACRPCSQIARFVFRLERRHAVPSRYLWAVLLHIAYWSGLGDFGRQRPPSPDMLTPGECP